MRSRPFPMRKLILRNHQSLGDIVTLGGAVREDQQVVEDKIPLLGDLPIGRLFRSSQKVVLKRCLVVFVTPRILPL